MSGVTDPNASRSADQSRNAVIEAEALAAAELTERDIRLGAMFGRTPEEESVWKSGYVLQHSAYQCIGCNHVFAEGDVVFRRRKREFFSAEWKLGTACSDCVAKWHPSWADHAKEPVECAGGCGVLVTSAYSPMPTTCSKRCREIADRAKRRVLHDDRDCAECATPFTPTRKDAEYCSTACRMRAYRRRRKEATC